MTPLEIARWHVARKTPWQHQGRGPHVLDCIGLVKDCFAAYGLRDWLDYGTQPLNGLLESRAREVLGSPLAKPDMRPADIVLIALPKVIRHVGIVGDYPGGLSLIHTSGSTKFVTEHRIDEKWMRRIRIVHRIEGAYP